MVQIKITFAIVLAAIMASSSAAPAHLNEHKLAARSPAPQVVVDVFNKAPGKVKREPEPNGRAESIINLVKSGDSAYHAFKGKREPGPPPAPQVIVDVFNKAPGKVKREPEPNGRAESVVNLVKAGDNAYHAFKGKREPGPPPAPQVVIDVFNNKGNKVKRDPEPGIGSLFKGIFGGKRRDLGMEERDVMEFEERDLVEV